MSSGHRSLGPTLRLWKSVVTLNLAEGVKIFCVVQLKIGPEQYADIM